MSESTLSPSSIVKLLRFKWVSKPQRSLQLVSKGSNEFEPEAEKSEISTEREIQSKNFEAATLSHLDTMSELDSTLGKSIKGILKGPMNSIVMKVKAKCATTTMIDSNYESPQSIENLNESKSKKVTFTAETKNAEIKRNMKYIRMIRKIAPQDDNQTEDRQIEASPSKNLTPRAGVEINNSPRNVFKISKTSRSDKTPRCYFNVNVQAKQPNEVEENRKSLLKIPSFEKALDSESPVRSIPSLQTILEESPIYPVVNSNDTVKPIPQIGSFSARNNSTTSPWNVYFPDRESSISLTPRDGQKMPRGHREKNLDYFAELHRKAPLVLGNKPSRPDSKTGPRRFSKSGSQENIFIISRKDYVKPMVNLHEKHEVRIQKAFA